MCNGAGGGIGWRRSIFSGAVAYFPAGRYATARRFIFSGAVMCNGAPFHISWRRFIFPGAGIYNGAACNIVARREHRVTGRQGVRAGRGVGAGRVLINRYPRVHNARCDASRYHCRCTRRDCMHVRSAGERGRRVALPTCAGRGCAARGAAARDALAARAAWAIAKRTRSVHACAVRGTIEKWT